VGVSTLPKKRKFKEQRCAWLLRRTLDLRRSTDRRLGSALDKSKQEGGEFSTSKEKEKKLPDGEKRENP